MTFQSYMNLFQQITEGNISTAPYDEDEILHYTQMNYTRSKRWLKTLSIQSDLKACLESINKPQQWEIISEPWCGDAAHIVPVIYQLSLVNPLVHFNIQLRDSDSEIDHYLTGASKSIPILIVRDENGKDMFHWGPRPQEATDLYLFHKNLGTPMEEIKTIFQQWYNQDKAASIQQEILTLLCKKQQG